MQKEIFSAECMEVLAILGFENFESVSSIEEDNRRLYTDL